MGIALRFPVCSTRPIIATTLHQTPASGADHSEENLLNVRKSFDPLNRCLYIANTLRFGILLPIAVAPLSRPGSGASFSWALIGKGWIATVCTRHGFPSSKPVNSAYPHQSGATLPKSAQGHYRL